ncbi:hypothetical protein BpHYR1_026436 [Brachionus plicatilis]|uniref:Uncharacterized protein n=1 Tax=Brachionus plicatilis TaxID=10195 RepID=A0A3M7S8K8_BRAPC|nr:hypothetical protein BpHYR1_026436 [Brachionus plicatilis]
MAHHLIRQLENGIISEIKRSHNLEGIQIMTLNDIFILIKIYDDETNTFLNKVNSVSKHCLSSNDNQFFDIILRWKTPLMKILE